MKQQITIEVDVPDGYEATGEYRKPKEGDVFLDHCGNARTAVCDHELTSQIILRKKWQPPAWLRDGWWVWRSSSNTWFVSRVDPDMCSSSRCDAVMLWESHGEEFVPPPVDKVQVNR